MSFFIAIAFFCTGDDCYFWKSDVNFYSQEECTKAVVAFMDSTEAQGVQSVGQCLKINTKNNI